MAKKCTKKCAACAKLFLFFLFFSFWPEETLARVLRACKTITFCFTGVIDVLLGTVVRKPRSALQTPGFLFLSFKKTFLWIISQLFLSASNHQLVGKMKPGRKFDSRPGHENFRKEFWNNNLVRRCHTHSLVTNTNERNES